MLIVEEENMELREIITRANRRLTALEKNILVISFDEEEEVIKGPCNSFEFRCSTCLVIKHAYLRQKKGKQKSSVCKQCANNKLKKYRNKSRKDGTSRYECVCGNILQRWGLAKHEQSTKHKIFMSE